ncbi:Golgi organization [Sparganum proliferum]
MEKADYVQKPNEVFAGKEACAPNAELPTKKQVPTGKKVCALKDELNGLHLQIESLELENVHVREEYATRLREKEELIQKFTAQTRLNGIEPTHEHALLPIPQIPIEDSCLNTRSDSPDFASEDFLSPSRALGVGEDIPHQLYNTSDANSERTRLHQHPCQIEDFTTNEHKKVDFCVQTDVEDTSTGHAAVVRSQSNSSLSADAIVDQLMTELDAYEFFNYNDFSTLSPSASDGASPTKFEQFLSRLRSGLGHITESNARLSESTSSPSLHDSDDESLVTRFARLQEALSSAVNCLPRPPGLSPTPGTPPTAATASPPWPPTRPEAQVAVLLAAEAAGRAELFRARDALASSRSIISELENENRELRRCLPPVDMGGEEQEYKQDRLPHELEHSFLQSSDGISAPTLAEKIVSVGVETDHLGDYVKTSLEFEKTELETKLENITRLFDLLQNVTTSFAGVIRGTCEPARFLENVDLLDATDPVQHEFSGLLRETWKQRCQKFTPPIKDTSSADTQTEKILQCCVEVMTDTTDHQESSCRRDIKGEVTAGAVNKAGETCSSKHCQTDLKTVCKQCLILVQFMSQCCDTLKSGMLSFDRTHILQQLDQLSADSDASLQLRNIVSNFTSMLLRKFEASAPDMGSSSSSFTERDEFDAIARAISDALGLSDPDSALIKSQQQLQTMESSDTIVTCMRRLLSEYVSLRGQYKRAEQDKLALAGLVRSKHAESEAYHAQLQTLLTERQANAASTDSGTASMEKLSAELQRLRSHLLQTEENHTKEALAAEEREISLKAQLADAEKRLATQMEFIASAEDLLTSAREERDAARVAGRASQSELNSLKTSYANLQKALENLEKEKQSDINMETQHFRLEAERLRAEKKSLLDKLADAQQTLKKQDDLVTASQVLRKQMELHAGRLAEAHDQARHYEEQIQILKTERQNLSRELDGKLDKPLMKSLLVSCLRLPPSKRPDAFRMLGRILDFTPDECNALGLSEPVGTNWRDWFRSTGEDASASGGDNQKQSFIELFAEFLEKESAPPTQIKLPTDHLQSMSPQNQSQVARKLRADSTSIVQQRGVAEHSGQPIPHDFLIPSDTGTPSTLPLFIPTISGTTPQRGASANPLLSAFAQK